MTNWDKIKDVIDELIPDATAEKFSQILMDGMSPCLGCVIENECIYKDEDAINLRCSDIILDWLNRERNEENAGN